MIKVLELFGGIGACSKALERLGVEHEIVDYVEIDKYAVKSFNAIHNTNFEPQDICKWDKEIEVDLIMHGSPCQDFSLAGKQAGGDMGSGTRSSLMYETIRIVEKLKPKYVIWENVKNLLSKKHRHNFDAYLETMEQLGYKNYYQVLNAKDYGIPQNRERVFTISIRNDIDKVFEFPPKQELKLRLKDMLEDKVDEKYYLSDKQLTYVLDMNDVALKSGRDINNRIVNPQIAKTISCRGAADQRADVTNFIIHNQDEEIKVKDIKKCIQVGENRQPQVVVNNTLKPIKAGYFPYPNSDKQHQSNTFYNIEGLSPTIDCCSGGNRQPKVLIKNATKKGYQEACDGDSVNLAYPESKTRRGRVGKQVSQTLQCNDNMGVIVKVDVPQMVRVRKYEVDIERLKELLRESRTISISDIANKLNKPKTLVEHWFRKDDCFAIPDADIWYELKKLLNITSDEFDKSITEFEEREGVFEKSNRCYFDSGIAPTITSASADEKIIVSDRDE